MILGDDCVLLWLFVCVVGIVFVGMVVEFDLGEWVVVFGML